MAIKAANVSSPGNSVGDFVDGVVTIRHVEELAFASGKVKNTKMETNLMIKLEMVKLKC